MKFKVTVLPQNKVILANENDSLYNLLVQNGFDISAPCGGNGKCGKCKVRLISGEGITPDEKGMIKSCRCLIKSDVTVELPQLKDSKITLFNLLEVKDNSADYGVILDIGTTTLAACLVGLSNGEIYKKAVCINPQRIYGSDVLSRISACGDGKLGALQSLVINKTKEILGLLSNDGKLNIKKLVVAANTTMLHIFAGVNPTSMGTYPFTPTFVDEQIIQGQSLGIAVPHIQLLPSVSAYIGADVTAGVLAMDMLNTPTTTLLIDIGTNGEIVLCHKGKLYAASTAAGPAIEGGNMECGVGGIPGAVNKVFIKDNRLCFNTIDGLKPSGICGSGYVDLIAVLLKENVIDEYGGWNYDSLSPLAASLKDDKFYLSDGVYLSRQDISEFQLAKAAISAGVKTLLIKCEVDPSMLESVYLAGGMGYYINPENAAATGLLPKEFIGKTKSAENTALMGARLCLIGGKANADIALIAKQTQTIELAFSSEFLKEYTEGMLLG